MTMLTYLKEHYLVNSQPIVVVMTPERRALQAWFPNPETHAMERMDTLIMDVLQDEASPISAIEFNAHCQHNKIDAGIPERSIQLSFRLAAGSLTKKANTIPAPIPSAAARNRTLAL